jgi:hypothetical protein
VGGGSPNIALLITPNLELLRTFLIDMKFNKVLETAKLSSFQSLTILYQPHSLTYPHIFISMVTSHGIVKVVKQWVLIWDSLLHSYGFKSYMKIVWLPGLSNLKLYSPTLIDVGFAPSQKFKPPLF